MYAPARLVLCKQDLLLEEQNQHGFVIYMSSNGIREGIDLDHNKCHLLPINKSQIFVKQEYFGTDTIKSVSILSGGKSKIISR